MSGALTTVSNLDVIELTDSEDDFDDHANKSLHLCDRIDLTSSPSDNEDNGLQKDTIHATFSDKCHAGKETKRNQSSANILYGADQPPRTTPVTIVPLFLDEEEYVPENGAGAVGDDDDGAILILDEPKGARKPLRVGTNASNPATPSRHLSVISKSIETPKARISRSQATLEKEKRAKYAQQLFDELNEAVFKSALPKETKLSWNKRLLTTAGRAGWRKSKDGSQSTEIELSEKILDCNERIRNTLSHEMCHLAAWVIDGNPKEGHGRLWKRWALKVMKKRPEIEISTRHNYEISYPYQWKCERCAKIYGRFSKSIHAEECVCGACKEGRLVPLFSTRRRTQKPVEEGSEPAKTAIPLTSDGNVNTELDSESEVEVLLRTFKSIAI